MQGAGTGAGANADGNLIAFRCMSEKKLVWVKDPVQVTLSNGRKMYVADRKDLSCARTGDKVATMSKKGVELKPLYSAVPKSKMI